MASVETAKFHRHGSSMNSAAAETAGLPAALHGARRRFIDLWGQMAPHWGITRTMARIHALLMIAPAPLTAERIMAELQISRGNVSMNLRDMVHWGIIQRTSVPGDRRDFFTTTGDVWAMFHNIFRERKRRELDPLLNRLQECLDAAGTKPDGTMEHVAYDAYVHRLEELLEFFLVFHHLLGRIGEQSPGRLAKIVKMLNKLV